MPRLEAEPEWRPADTYQKIEPVSTVMEPDVFIDTWGIKLDHMLGMINASESYFSENPQQTLFTYVADVPGDDMKREDQYAIQITPKTLHTMKYAALGVFEDLVTSGAFGDELGRDILKIWKVPAEIELVPDKEEWLV